MLSQFLNNLSGTTLMAIKFGGAAARDADGVMRADPSLSPAAHRLKQSTFNEFQEVFESWSCSVSPGS